ncbi:uncharacterized protein GGS25DRAFT_113587 [Hypoxylon fragiforme]|uniref:uncharacterized protein n=1 Tax=Hypoxylon fragiforme TaxID=63214 RepID=UPI0020C7322D|nr:uncharacterized protein GGS25DRAFT_113587 [Hypoxylon fragiforme]KAI2612286.1 hypothetical protein GGS25DRAFT_113587 [Hypoxylon fragiforme]
MSSSESSSSPPPQRTPLQERSESENNKLQIRIVPYSPPRPSESQGTASTSHAPEPDAREDDAQTAAKDPTTPKATRARARSYNTGNYGADYSPSPSFTTPGSPLSRVKGKGVSGTKPVPQPADAPQPPVLKRPNYGSNIGRTNAQQPSPAHNDDEAISPTCKRPRSRRGTFISVHSDKTFSIVLKPTRTHNSDTSGSISAPFSNTSTVTSHEESSFDASTDDRHGSPLSSVAERSTSSYSTSYSPATVTGLPEEQIESPSPSPSPWNYRMVGGLRKVPDLKGKGKEKQLAESPLPPLPEAVVTPPEPSSPLATKQSFNSQQSDLSKSTNSTNSNSTIEETTNYKIIGRSSPPLPDSQSIDVPTSSSSPNYKVLGRSSPVHTLASSTAPGFADTPGSKNYIVYGDTSTISSADAHFRGHQYHSSDESSVPRLRTKYSQESLVVPPLRPHKRSSSENLGYNKKQSGDSLRGRANSFSSLSSLVSQDAPSIFGGSTPNVVLLAHTPSISSIPRSTWAGLPSATQPRTRMDIHQWSSQLSTVMSEYEGSDPGSRLASAISNPEHRVSSAFGSRDSRQMRSISSSLGLEALETRGSHSRSNSRSDSLSRPSPAFVRGGREFPLPSPRAIRDHDEHGDGLADLQHRPSRTRLGFSRQASDRSLRSSASSRSLTSASIPSWARLYYGSGERRWLATSGSIRSVSEAGDSRPASPWVGRRRSPSQDQFTNPIYNPRRRPKDTDPQAERPDSMEIGPALESGEIRLAPRKMTSSIWSPHLRLDTRASRFSVWNAPSVTWSADSGVFGKRNIQVILFLVGFFIPFSWMIAAFLPLPPRPTLAMDERDQSTREFHDSDQEYSHPPRRRHILVDESRYQSARWWRNVNRFMSVAGLLILGAVAALVVIGVRQNWAQR